MSSVLTIPEAAVYLKLSRAKLYELLKRGDIVGRKIDGKTVFLVPDLDRYIADLPLWTGRAA